MQAARKRVLSPKAEAMTRQKREARRRQAQRFARATEILRAEAASRLLGADLAWRRWEDSDALAQPLVER